MSAYWNRRVKSLRPYVPGEQPRDRTLIKLNTNENPYPPSPRVLEALRNAAGETLRLYPDPESRELREAIAAAYRVKPEQVFAGNGSDETLAFVFAAFFEAGDPAALPLLFPDITYSFYPVYARLWGVPYRTVPVGKDFSVNPEDYQVPAGGVVLANPNAPTGIALKAAKLLRIAAYQAAAGRVTVIDEAYGAFVQEADAAADTDAVFPGTASVTPYIEQHPNLLTVHTLSKMGALAGLRVGFAIGNEELIEGLCRVRDSFNSYPLDRLAQAGAVAALADAAYYAGLTRRIIAARDRVTSSLAALGFETLPSQANFVFTRHPGKSGAELFAGFREQGILVRHFNTPGIADFLRVTIGTDDQMDRFLEACKNLLRTREVRGLADDCYD
ncbi:MAG: histidinol-phosphate transaminase [Treponema sp.]|jgi:histidinol-phosphate aminotransferase|nr:histidinol-phosphate transaminase [Treponema sp.]